MRVCVIGAGVIGCATAYQLSRVGHEVTLVDAAPGPASGTSAANGAQLSYSYVEPLASPSTLAAIPKLLLDPESPLRLHLRPSARQLQWLASFLCSCTPARARHGSLALLESAALSRETNERWMEEDGLDFGLQRHGKLVLCPSASSFRYQARQVQLQAGYGGEQVLLDRADCVAQEPALEGYANFVGGVWTASECAADPRVYCSQLLRFASSKGMRCLWSTRAVKFVIEGGRAVRLETDGDGVVADSFVLATGIEAPRLGRQLGEALSIEPIKGYSLTLAMLTGRRAPATSVTDLGRKTVFAPLAGKLRVAAFAELGSADLGIPARRLEQMQQTVEAIYPGLCDFRSLGEWSGLRPATPNSLPIVRQSRVSNVFLNVGHGALGLTLAAGTAVQVAEAIHDSRAIRATSRGVRLSTLAIHKETS